jgi:hypothetical protein
MIVLTDKLLVFALLIVSYLWLAFSRQARERAAGLVSSGGETAKRKASVSRAGSTRRQ